MSAQGTFLAGEDLCAHSEGAQTGASLDFVQIFLTAGFSLRPHRRDACATGLLTH